MQWDIKRRHRSVRTHSKHNTNAWTNTTKPRTALEHSHQPGCRSPSTWWSPWRCPPRRCPRTARSRWSVWPTPPSVRSDCPTTRLLISSDWDNDGSQHDIITITLHYITLQAIRQLSCILRQADQIFQDLGSQCSQISQRTLEVQSRVASLSVSVENYNPRKHKIRE